MKRYQDYVIKDGKLVGQFEKMYQEFDNPWHQASVEYNANSYSRNAAILNLRRFKIASVVEFGCGLGYYTDLIHRTTGIRIQGVDISPTAVEKAKKLWPHLDFVVDQVKNVECYAEFDAILFAEITWYILEDLQDVLEKIQRHFRGKYLLHNLVFYKGQQQYGTEYFTNLQEFIAYMPFPLLGYSEASTAGDDCFETSCIFKVEEKGSAADLRRSHPPGESR